MALGQGMGDALKTSAIEDYRQKNLEKRWKHEAEEREKDRVIRRKEASDTAAYRDKVLTGQQAESAAAAEYRKLMLKGQQAEKAATAKYRSDMLAIEKQYKEDSVRLQGERNDISKDQLAVSAITRLEDNYSASVSELEKLRKDALELNPEKAAEINQQYDERIVDTQLHNLETQYRILGDGKGVETAALRERVGEKLTVLQKAIKDAKHARKEEEEKEKNKVNTSTPPVTDTAKKGLLSTAGGYTYNNFEYKPFFSN